MGTLLAGFPACFGNQPGDVGLRQTKFVSSPLAVLLKAIQPTQMLAAAAILAAPPARTTEGDSDAADTRARWCMDRQFLSGNSPSQQVSGG